MFHRRSVLLPVLRKPDDARRPTRHAVSEPRFHPRKQAPPLPILRATTPGATFYFRRYLETNPPAAQARATEEVLTQVEAQLASSKTAQADAERAETERKKVEAQRQHDAEAQRRTLELEKTRLEVANAQRAALEASLKTPPPTPVTQRWWFWTGIGAVVIGGAVAATLVATAPQPVQTTFPDINAR